MEYQQVLPSTGPRTLESDLGAEAYQELLADFLEHLTAYLTDLSAAAADQDVPAARYVAHQIKGNALAFGAVGLDRLAGRLLGIGKAQCELLRPLVGEIEKEVRQLQADKGARTLETDAGVEVDQQLLADFLGHLPLQLVDLNAAAAAEDVVAARYVAYQIKGYAPGLGASDLDGLADRLLAIGKDQGELLRPVVAEIEREAGHLQPDVGVGTLEGDVGSEVYQALLADFLIDLSLQRVDLNAAAAAGDVAAARYVAHQIKGHALSFGAVRLDGLAGRVLRINKDQSDLITLLVGEIGKEIGRLQATLGGPGTKD